MKNQPRIAIIHDWLIDWGGAEQVLTALLEIWPNAPMYTLVSDPSGQCKDLLNGREVHNSFIARFPRAKKWYRAYLGLMPLAIEQFDLRGYDIIISSSYAVAKGVITSPTQLHISYVHSPIRYAWDLQYQYLEEAGLATGVKSFLARILLHYIRNWDVRTSNGVDHFISNSAFITKRIWKVYRREAVVIHPPVDVDKFELFTAKEDYYLTASRMVPYKKIDLIVKAFVDMPEKKLVVIGDGPDFKKIRRKAGSNIRLLGYQPVEVLKEHMQRARAFVFAAEEDFGIVPLEAQACGTPVIAFGKGGALETVLEGQTGLFFYEQSTTALQDAIHRFEKTEQGFSPQLIRAHAEKFNKRRFKEEIKAFVLAKWSAFSDGLISSVTS